MKNIILFILLIFLVMVYYKKYFLELEMFTLKSSPIPTKEISENIDKLKKGKKKIDGINEKIEEFMKSI